MYTLDRAGTLLQKRYWNKLDGSRYMNLPYAKITEAAYRLLLAQAQAVLPIHPLQLQVPGALVLSYREWALRSDLSSMQFENVLPDGCICLGLWEGSALILYNDRQPYARTRFTLFHELGHYLLGHRVHNHAQELEAHFFAGQCMAPTALLLDLRRRGYVLDVNFLQCVFDMSRAAAQRKLSYLKRHPAGHPGPLDALLVAHFEPYLAEYFPDVRSVRDAWALASYDC